MTYYGIPVAAPSGGFIVRYQGDDGKPHDLAACGPLAEHGFAWGSAPRGTEPNAMRLHAHRVTTLALSLCAHILKNESSAVMVAQRVKHRTVVILPWNTPWTFQTEELLAAIDDAKDSDADTARAAADVARDRPPIAREGGPGMAGKPIKWETPSDLSRSQGRMDMEDEED